MGSMPYITLLLHYNAVAKTPGTQLMLINASRNWVKGWEVVSLALSLQSAGYVVIRGTAMNNS